MVDSVEDKAITTNSDNVPEYNEYNDRVPGATLSHTHTEHKPEYQGSCQTKLWLPVLQSGMEEQVWKCAGELQKCRSYQGQVVLCQGRIHLLRPGPIQKTST